MNIYTVIFSYMLGGRANFRKASISELASAAKVLLLIYTDEIKREKMILIYPLLIFDFNKQNINKFNYIFFRLKTIN